MTSRDAYEKVGGHAAVKSSLHDGIKLPRAYRTAGMMTDICDATDLAVCRMYRSAGQVWNGLAKNAREGMASPELIGVWTVLLFGGHVLPFLLVRPPWEWSLPWLFDAIPVVAVFLSYLTRFGCAILYRGSWLGAALHPLGVSVLLAIQWYALGAVGDRQAGRVERAAPPYTSSSSVAAWSAFSMMNLYRGSGVLAEQVDERRVGVEVRVDLHLQQRPRSAGRASSAPAPCASISPRPLNRVTSGFAFARSPARISSLWASSRAQCVSLPTSMRYSGGWAM